MKRFLKTLLKPIKCYFEIGAMAVRKGEPVILLGLFAIAFAVIIEIPIFVSMIFIM